MKRFTIFCAVITTTTLAMQDKNWPRPIDILRPIIISFLTNKKPLSTHEIDQANRLIKEIRAQSPAQGLEYQHRLISRISDDSMNTEGFRFPRVQIQNVCAPKRVPSPLATCGAN